MTRRILAFALVPFLAACAGNPPAVADVPALTTIPASAATPSEGWDVAALAATRIVYPRQGEGWVSLVARSCVAGTDYRTQVAGQRLWYEYPVTLTCAAPTPKPPSTPTVAAAWVKPVSSMTCRPPGGNGYFGAPRPGHVHAGVDLNSKAHVYRGNAIRAVHAGTAHWGSDPGGAGTYVWVDHGDGSSSWYFHMASRAVANGAKVKAGTVIGYVGATGNADAAHNKGVPQYHLHLEIRVPLGTTKYGMQLSRGQVDPGRFLAAHGVRVMC